MFFEGMIGGVIGGVLGVMLGSKIVTLGKEEEEEELISTISELEKKVFLLEKKSKLF